MYRAAIIILLITVGAAAQEPQSPCSAAETKAAAAEARAAAERVRAETLLALRDKLQQELAALNGELIKQKDQSGVTDRQIAVEQSKSASLAESLGVAQRENEDLKKEIALRDSVITSLIKERDHARTWKASFARVFGIKGKK